MSTARNTLRIVAFALNGAQRGLAQSTTASTHMAGMQMPAAPTPNPPRIGPPMLHTLALAPFVDALPLPETIRPTLQNGHRSVTLTMQEIHAKVHRDIPPTRMWSYGPAALGPLIEARSGEPLQIRWVNNLPTKHFL